MTKQTIRGAAIAAVLSCGAMAACDGNNLALALPRAEGPSYDGGMGYGSGNRTQEGDATTTATAGAAADTTGRGGMGYGSGN
jgi:hypothetical protein